MTKAPQVVLSAAYGAPETWERVRNVCVAKARPLLPTLVEPATPLQVLPNYALAAARAVYLAQRFKAELLLAEGALELLVAGAFRLAAGLRDLPFVAVDAHYPPLAAPNLRWRLQRQLTRRVLSNAVLGCLASEDQERFARLLKAPPERFGFVPHYASPSTFAAGHRKHPQRDVIFCGGIYQRDFETLYQAAAKLARPFELVTDPARLPAGPPPPNVHVVGRLPKREFLEHLASARLVVLPLQPVSWVAGLSVLVDAMALGKPVIATRNWGLADYVRHAETGLLCRPRKVSDLADALDYLWRSPEAARRLGLAARSYAREHLTFSAHLRALEKLLKRALDWQGAFDYTEPTLGVVMHRQ